MSEIYNEQPALSSPVVGSDLSCISRSPFTAGAPFEKVTEDEKLVYTKEKLNVPEYVLGWNANTNVPSLASSVGVEGATYIVTEGGTTALDGITLWAVGNLLHYVGGAWTKIDYSAAGGITTGTMAITWTGLVGAGVTSNVRYTLQGDMVFLTFDAVSVPADTVGVLLSSTQINLDLQPTVPLEMILKTFDNGNVLIGELAIFANGTLVIGTSPNGGSFSGISDLGNSGFPSFAIAYKK